MAGRNSNSWNYYRDFTFPGYSDDISRNDSDKIGEIVSYLNHNPSAQVGIDGPNSRYVHSIVDALEDAGVPSQKIQTGAFGNPQLSRNNRVAVLMSGY
jgi:hypothetical protein